MLNYPSRIKYNDDWLYTDVSFILVKTIDCKTDKTTEMVVDKFERLKKEDFNRVSIPKFIYKVEGNIITQQVQFIKGYPIAIFNSKYATIVYEDVVMRSSDWTFNDFSFMNFIVEKHTQTIYAIDFLSYHCFPDRDERKFLWDDKLKRDKKLMGI